MILWINGDWATGLGERRVKTDPASDGALWHGNGADMTQVAQACQAVRAAFVGWAKQPFSVRQTIAERSTLLLENNETELTQITARETGEPHWEVMTELTMMINKAVISVKAYHACTNEQHGELLDGAVTLRYRPHDVPAVFGPYNSPGHLPNGHIVPALLAGNTLIFKPNESTPWTGETVTKLWEQTGLPSGVLNLVQGGRETGQALGALEDLDGLLLTSSTNIGYQLHKQLSGQPEKILIPEMGGNNPLITENPKDIDVAVCLTIQSAFVIAGQRRTCARHLLVKKDARGDTLLVHLVEVSQHLVPGNWDAQSQPFTGGLISEQAAQRVCDAWQHLASLGGRTLSASRLTSAGTSLLTPGTTELIGAGSVPNGEVLDPLLGVRHYDSSDNAIRLANNARFGLLCGLVSSDHGQFEQLLLEAQAEVVNWNKPLTGAASTALFGGVSTSGNHCAGAWYTTDHHAWPMASLKSLALALPTAPNLGLGFSREDKLWKPIR